VRKTIRTFTDAARELGTDRATVRGLVRAWGSPTYPVPYNGNAKGIDDETFRRMRKALRPAAQSA